MARTMTNPVRLAGLAVALALVGGCSEADGIEFQNDGPWSVTVVLVLHEPGRGPVTLKSVVVPAGGHEAIGLEDDLTPNAIEVTATWGKAVRRQTFYADVAEESASLPRSLRKGHRYNDTRGLSLSPEAIRWGPTRFDVGLTKAAFASVGLSAIGLVAWGFWRRWQWSREPRIRTPRGPG